MKRWLSSLSPKMPIAVVTASSVNALSFARSLGRRGVPVIIVDSDRHLAVHTRYARVVKLGPCRTNPGAWTDALLEVGRSLQTPGVLIPTADSHTTFLAENRQALEPYFRFLVLPKDQARQCVSKRFQIGHAQRLGMPVPKTWFPETREEVEQMAPELPYPCILKPDSSCSGVKVLAGSKLLIVRTPHELRDAFAGLADSGLPCIVQEIIPGPDTELVSYLGFWNADGEETAFVTKRKLRQFPAHFGNGSIQRTENLPEIAELSRCLLRSLDYRGFAGVEFKFDRRDSSFRFIEFNPRSSAMNELAVAAGVDFPWIAYQSLAGHEIQAKELRPFRPGVSCVNEEWDLQAFHEMRGRGELTFRQWLASLRGAHRIIAAWDDPGPFMAGLARMTVPALRRSDKP